MLASGLLEGGDELWRLRAHAPASPTLHEDNARAAEQALSAVVVFEVTATLRIIGPISGAGRRALHRPWLRNARARHRPWGHCPGAVTGRGRRAACGVPESAGWGIRAGAHLNLLRMHRGCVREPDDRTLAWPKL